MGFLWSSFSQLDGRPGVEMLARRAPGEAAKMKRGCRRGISAATATLLALTMRVPLAEAAPLTTITVTGNGIVRFIGHFGPSVAGGMYAVYTYGGALQNSLVDLGRGIVPPTGDVDFSVSSTAAQAATTSNQFEISVSKLVSQSTMQASVAIVGVGVTADDLAAGLTVDFETVLPDTVLTYATAAAAISAGQMGGGTMGPSSQSTSSGSGSPCADCIVVPSGDALVTLNAQSDPSQTVYGYDIPGQFALRGKSERVLGVVSEFRMLAGDTQEWQNGYRTQAGPFKVESVTQRALGSQQETFWPKRSDCWTPSLPNDGPNCSSVGQDGPSQGHQLKYGRDTWRWAKGIHAACDPLFCLFTYYYTHEDLWNKQYDGGTESECPTSGCVESRTDYFKRPSEVRAGSWGSWAPHSPGAREGVYYNTDRSRADGVSVTVSFPESYSSTNFTSTEKHTKTVKWGDYTWFRPTTDYQYFYRWYRYDRGTSWADIYWTCEFAYDWGAGNPGPPDRCFNLGA